MGILLLPSLTTPSFHRICQIDRKEALNFMRSFAQQAIQADGAVDRVAFNACNMAQAPSQEQGLGLDFQLLERVPVEALDLDTAFDSFEGPNDGLSDETVLETLEGLAYSTFTGVRGRRALFVEREDSLRLTLILGTLVTYNECRYTREFWDEELSNHVQDHVANETLDDGGDAGHNLLQAMEVADVARDLRQLGRGNLLSVPKNPVLLALADRLDTVVEHLGGVAPTSQPTGAPPALDVDKLIEQGRAIAQDTVATVSKNVNKARNWLADRLSDMDKH